MLEKIVTQDGSYSLYDSSLNETFHSRKGALTESLHVYINEGLKYFVKEYPKTLSLNVFEMGFGTGLNAILTKRFSESNNIKIFYTSIDKYPLSNNQIESVKLKDLSKNESNILNASWGKKINISSFFDIYKIHADFVNVNYKKLYDLIFYDAFAFHAQPSMWSKKNLKRSVNLLKKNGIWISYCSKGEVGRILNSFGLLVQRVKGPPGKREMLRAIKI